MDCSLSLELLIYTQLITHPEIFIQTDLWLLNVALTVTAAVGGEQYRRTRNKAIYSCYRYRFMADGP